MSMFRLVQTASIPGSLVCAFIFLVYVIFSEPRYAQVICPSIYGPLPQIDGLVPVQESKVDERHPSEPPVDCRAVFSRNPDEIQRAKEVNWCTRHDSISDNKYVVISGQCDDFKKQRGYLDYPSSSEETSFPIAFSILTHENAEQTERLLRAIYRPQNVYCIHVDRKSPIGTRRAMSAIAKCFDNVIFASPAVDVRWAEFPVVEAELLCLRQLWEHKTKWKYFINLTGREFPLRTNWELVQILRAYNGSNDVDGNAWTRPLHWTKYRWMTENLMTKELKPPVPHSFLIHKGSAHIAVTRDFVDYVLHDQRALDLLEWMKDIRVPDEHYFATLNHNPKHGVPGAFRGITKSCQTRFKIWQSGTETCDGRWVRWVCNLGAGDLQRLTSAKQMFVNKFILEHDPIAFQCMEQWYLNRTRSVPNPDFDVEFYRQMPWVKQHV